ncbi:DNA gyrase, B subunit [Thermocrinis albus DSM 14484]|uniref:DNA gyrase subunit B n=1 Tax=Thermocrinis albus (strain DSM 14484 / JCM 11386 / HI 11/12) TaxID=638303 RepID=D3SMP7_THEAH|nr:DNA topoisomerase (ATP-hydrolyzing) subunit B [Thermocrinis albus]ADC90027.1 DNA gyrase, B subunit [Thermocrinis albus DSM 14484]
MKEKRVLQEEYQAQDIKAVTGLQHVRLRPSMYIGDVGERGLHHLIWEILDNAVDEHMAGYASHITVTIHADMSVSVEDDGRGIPVDIHPETGIPAVQMVFTVLGAGGKFDKKVYRYSGGLHGVGASVVNALSEWLVVEVYRDGNIYRQEYVRGEPTTPVQIVGKTRKRGTKVTFKPDPEIFETTKIKFDIVEKRIRELAYLNPNCTFRLVDERTGKDLIYRFEKGIEELVLYLARGKEPLIKEVIRVGGEHEGVIVDIAFTYTKDYKEVVESFVNNIKTLEGGTHVTGFRSGLTKAVMRLLPNIKLQKELKETITGEDLREGLVAVVSCKVPDPQFEGQTKTKLGNQNVKSIVESVVYEQLSSYFDKNRDVLRVIVEKAIEAALAREAAKKAKELVRRRSPLEDTTLPGKLADCSEKDPEKCELFIVEGESAGGSAKQGRDRRFQAILPLRGKILNVEKARLDKVLSNEEIKAIVSSIGCGIGEDMDLSKLRYHRIILMTDADVDGSHIRTLLLTFFYRYMPKLVEGGYLYIAQPPLYRAKKGKTVVYLKDDRELEQLLMEDIKKEGYVRDKEGLELRGEKLMEFLKTIREVEEGYRALVKKKGQEVVDALMKVKPHEKDLREEEKARSVAEKLATLLPDMKLELRFDEDEGAFEILLSDERIGKRVLINVDLLSSLTYKNLLEGVGLTPPLTVGVGKREKTLEDLFSLYRDILDLAKENWEIQRYKGLGEMNPEQLWETTMNPATRRLLRVTIEDAAEADRIFSILMGEEVEPRREFIEAYAREVRNLDV